MKFRLVTFADGSASWRKTAHRLERQASRSKYFSSVEVYDLRRIALESPEWYKRSQKFISNNPRGFGYWIWKPEIARLQLADLKKDELGVVYLDAGFSINAHKFARNRMKYYEELVVDSRPLFFQLNSGNEGRYWIKKLAKDHFTEAGIVLDDVRLIVGGAFFAPKGDLSLSILEAWDKLLSRANYSLLVDGHDTDLENQDFIEHRHDQALLTGLLLSEFSQQSHILQDETYFSGKWGKTAKGFPFWATRLRSGFPMKSDRLVWRGLRRIERCIVDR